MKKLVVLALLAAMTLPLIADDASVLPTRTLRLSVVPMYSTCTQNYNKDGNLVDIIHHDRLTTGNLGFELEYGISNWISADLQWTPGVNLYSKVVSDIYKNENMYGFYDLAAVAKIQIVGEKAPVRSRTIRFTLAPGLKIPMPEPDWQEQFKAKNNHDDYTWTSVDKHAFGIVGRLYVDYVLNKIFFLNLYSEYIYFFERKSANEGPAPTTYDLAYGYALTLEAEPHFEFLLNKGLKLGLSLPANYIMGPDVLVNGDVRTNSAYYFLKLSPTASLSLMKSFIPLEFKAGYSLPLVGEQVHATSSIILEVKASIKFK
jgi:hypothetical protein